MIWDPQCISRQTEDIVTVRTAFLYYQGVLGTLHLPVLTTEALTPPLARPPRVPLFRYPIPEPILEGWKSKVAVDSHSVTSLAKAMDQSILASLAHSTEGSPTGDALDPQYISASILGLANDIQAILGDALVESTTMFPHKSPHTPNRGTPPTSLAQIGSPRCLQHPAPG